MSAACSGPHAGEAPADAPLVADPSNPATGILDELRRGEFRRQDISGHVYLDHTGRSLNAADDERLAAVVAKRDVERTTEPSGNRPGTVSVFLGSTSRGPARRWEGSDLARDAHRRGGLMRRLGRA
jgi:hypothetical protein